jgi:hypothetical protein
MSKTGDIVIQLVEISKEIQYFANNMAFLNEDIVKSWADEVEELALEIGHD